LSFKKGTKTMNHIAILIMAVGLLANGTASPSAAGIELTTGNEGQGSARVSDAYGLRSIPTNKLLYFSNRSMKEDFWRQGGYHPNEQRQGVISRRGMRNHVNNILKRITTLKHDAKALTTELDTFCNAQRVKIERNSIVKKMDELNRLWSQQRERYEEPAAYTRSVGYMNTWSDWAWDFFNPFKIFGLLRINYRAPRRLKPELDKITQDIKTVRATSVYNHVYIGMIVEKMGQTENSTITEAVSRLTKIQYSFSKEQQMQSVYTSKMNAYTDSYEAYVIPLLETVLDFYTEVNTFNKALANFWHSVSRALTPDTIDLVW